MNQLEAALRRAADDLTRLAVGWALVGGFAVSARTEPRFTRDVDIAVAVDDDGAAERLVRSLLADGYELLASIEHDVAGRLATGGGGPPSARNAPAAASRWITWTGTRPRDCSSSTDE
jgi:hypothetical protein